MNINYIKDVERIDEILSEKKSKEELLNNKEEKKYKEDFDSLLEQEKAKLIKTRKEIKIRQLKGQKEYFELLSQNKITKIR
ncbi:MAG: hypothetical protein J6G98_00095 [Bacilli bacterium]|nr:hypothetical protein [Bacilli bacterium]